MKRLKKSCWAQFDFKGGSYEFVENFPERYIAILTKRPKLRADHAITLVALALSVFAPDMQAVGCGGAARLQS
jgi:phosphomannomutase/phosphoglucomutase